MDKTSTQATKTAREWSEQFTLNYHLTCLQKEALQPQNSATLAVTSPSPSGCLLRGRAQVPQSSLCVPQSSLYLPPQSGKQEPVPGF